MPEGYEGWEPYFFIAKNKEEMADMLANSAYTSLRMMADEFKVGYAQLREQGLLQGYSEYEYISNTDLFVTWNALGGGNYELYIMWGSSIENYQ